MKNTKKVTLKIIIASVILMLIGGMLFIANSFFGNPVSAMMADRAIRQYVDENYSFLDLEVEKARYNFKTGSYMARAKSKTSIDTRFAIYYRKGKVYRDDYESYVLSKFNTLKRLSEEYSDIAQNIVAAELGYKNNTTMVMYNKNEYKDGDDILELDMEFNKALPLDAEVTIRIGLEDSSLEEITKILTKAHKAFVENDCYFSEYGLFAENDKSYVMVHGVSPEHIESGELKSLLERAIENKNQNDIRVFIKEDKKSSN